MSHVFSLSRGQGARRPLRLGGIPDLNHEAARIRWSATGSVQALRVRLEFVYEHLLDRDVRVVDLFFFGYCIGANTPNVCGNMRTRFGVG